jgi:hypothetical protein
MSLVEHDLTDDQWHALMTAWGGCAYCGADGPALQKDCMLPISRGGRYTLPNDESRFLLRQLEVLAVISRS